MVFRNISASPVTILSQKEAYLKDYEEGHKIREVYKSNKLSGLNKPYEIPLSTVPPQEDLCTILVDGAWKRSTQQYPQAGIGWAAYVNNTKVFEGNSKIMALSPLQNEAYAMYRGLHEAITKGFNRILVLLDSTELVQTTDRHNQPFNIATIVYDMKALRSKFNSCKICKVSREVVDPAHILATAARQGKIII